ncbi:MAG: MFS transporter [Rhizorhabdus sp.]
MRRIAIPSRRWAIVIALHILVAFCGTISASKGVFFPYLLEAFDLSHAAGATLLSANIAVGGVVSLLGGWLLVKRARAETFVAIVVLAIGSGYVLAGLAQGYASLLAAYMLMAGGGIMLVVSPFVIANWFSTHRGLAIGIALSGTTTSGVVINPLIGLVVEQWGWRTGYIGLGASIAAIGIPLALGVIRSSPEAVEAATTQTPAQLPGFSFREAIGTRDYWLILIGYMIFWASTNAYFLHFIPAVRQSGFSLTDATLIMSALFLLAAVTKIASGYLADRTSVKTVLWGSIVAGGAALAALTVYTGGGSAGWLALFVPLYGLTYSAPLVLFPMIVSRIFGKRQFTIIDATIMVTGSVAGSLGGVYAGYVHDVTGSFSQAFASLGLAMALVGAAFALFLARGARAPLHPPLVPAGT